MKTKNLKRSLGLSILSLVLCVSMLIGTTFAWFTDSVSSANNIIKTGNLDVELYYQAEGSSDWTKVTGTTNIFKENTLWEPGHTEVVKLKVVNEGSLALKYNLGVNVADEQGSVNQLGNAFKLSDYIKFGVIAGAQAYSREQAIAAAEANGATLLKTAYNSGSVALLAAEEQIVTMVVYMPTEVGNEANAAAGAADPTIHLGINLLATQYTYEKDSFNDQYDADAMTLVTSAEEAQAALDNVTPGAIIQLAPGVNYGTLHLRPYAGAAATKVVDWIGNNYGWETYTLFEDVTIVGAPGATVDAIEIEGGTYYYTEHSQAATYPVMLSLVELKNVVIDGVTFTGKGGYDPQGHGNAINLAGNNIKVNGLTLKNCVLENEGNNARLLYKTEGTTHVHKYAYEGVEYTFVGNLKDITVTGCTFNGGYMGLELRETENLTITNNVFNVADRNILLPTNTGCTYTGNVTITGNVSNNAKERFVRADGMGDAVVVIKDNTIVNYMGADADYIKVTNANNVTIENNVMATEVYGLTLIPNGENSKIIVNDKEGFLNLTKLSNDWTDLFTDGNGNEFINYANGAGVSYYYSNYWTVILEADIDLGNQQISPVLIKLATGTGASHFDGKGHTIKNAVIVTDPTAQNGAGLFDNCRCDFKNLKLDNIHVTGSNVGSSTAGVLAGDCNFAIDNITITNSSVTGGKYTGGVIGYGYTDITNCTLTNVTVKGGYKLGGVIGYIAQENGKTANVTGNTLTDCTVDGIGGGVFAGGKTEYVAGKVVGNYNANGDCNNNTVTNMTTTDATENIGKIESGMTVNQ